MATIRQRCRKWQVQVRQKNRPLLSKTFIYRKDALQWARETEIQFQRNLLNPETRDFPSFHSLIDRYIRTVTCYKRGAQDERIRLKAFQRQGFTSLPINHITAKIISEYRDKRLQEVKPSTVLRELNIIQHIFSTAQREWCLDIGNPVRNIKKPKDTQRRERRLTDYEYRFLVKGNSSHKHLQAIIELALETGMRRGEILRIHPNNIGSQILTIHQTKNGYTRTIPLSRWALSILQSSQLPFPVTANALRLAWDRLKKKGNIKDLHFHDLRHEAISRFFEKGLSVAEVSLISGHRDVRQLFRYTHLKAEDILKKVS